MMKLSDVNYLKNGPEVKIFARPEMSVITPGANTTEIDKLLLHYQKTMKPSPNEMVELYKKSFEITEQTINENKEKAEAFEKQLEDALTFLKNLIGNYQLLKKQVFGMIQIKNS